MLRAEQITDLITELCKGKRESMGRIFLIEALQTILEKKEKINHLNSWMIREARNMISRDQEGGPYLVKCRWFMFCDREMTGYLDHPTLGKVPTCDKCKKWYRKTKREVKRG